MAERLVGQESRDSQCLANCIDVAAELLAALQGNDIKSFDKLLDDAEPEEINKRHEYPHYTTCLEWACANGQADFLALLIKHEAEVDTYNSEKGMRPLHMACRNAHHDCVELLLRAGADVNARDGHSFQTPLNILVSTWKESKEAPTLAFPTEAYPTSKEAKFAKCLQLLLENEKINLDAEDENGQGWKRTALEWAVYKQNAFAVKTLISYGANVNEHVKQAVKKTKKYMPELERLIDVPALNDTSSREVSLKDRMWQAIRSQDHTQLEQLLQNAQSNVSRMPFDLMGLTQSICVASPIAELDDTNQNLTYVQHCSREGLAQCLQVLLSAGANPNLFSFAEPRPPIILAASNGHGRILKVLLSNPSTEVGVVDSPNSKQTIFHKIVSRLSEQPAQYLECLAILLDCKEALKHIDAPDVLGNTPLHYAVQTGVEEAVLLLLRHGASLGAKNVLNETPINNMLPTTLETFLDECIEQNQKEGRASRDYHITFKYDFLASKTKSVHSMDNVNESASGSPKLAEDKESGNFIPKIDRSYENLSTTEETKTGGCYPESEALWYLSRSLRHKYLLRHPVVTSFLLLKWHKIRHYFYVNLVIYLFTVLLLTSYVLVRENSLTFESSNTSEGLLNALWGLLAFLVAILFIREFFQFGIAPFRYICSLENYFELGMLIATSYILANAADPESVRHISALAVLLAWAEFLLLIGRHPRLSIFVATFTSVTISFFKLLLWYSVLIVGFALSFHLIFKSPASTGNVEEASQNATKSETPEDDKNENFQTVPLTLLKMIAMMTGELEFSDLPFHLSPVTSRFIFLTFVFLITIVLLNLLNGLAVSDTQAIRSEAETISYASLVELISYTEAMLLGDPFHFLSNYPPFRWLRRLPDANCCRFFLRMPSLRPCMQRYSTLLFERCLPNKAYTVYPNRRGTLGPNKDVIGIPVCSCHKRFSLPSENIEATYARLQEIQSAASSSNEKWHEKLEELRETVANLTQDRRNRRINDSDSANKSWQEQFEELRQAVRFLSHSQTEILRLLQTPSPSVVN